MIKKPFVGQSAIANGLLDLVHTDVCGPLSILARGGFSYFITFTDDHSWYGYVYLMRPFDRIEVVSTLSVEFIDYLKENGILSQWTPPGTLQLNGVAERRNQTLLDIVRSMMSFTELPPSFWGYALEIAAKLLNIAPSKSVPQTSYEIWHGKPTSYKYLRVWGSPAYVKRLVGDKLDSRSSLCSVPVLRRSTRESGVPERYGFIGLTSQLDNDPKMYGEAMSDIDSNKWLEAMKSKMDSMGSNQARLVAKGYTQRPGVDFEETYSPVAMAKSIRILLAIAAWYYYKIWQMDVKTAFLNGFDEEEIFMDQPEGFTAVGEEQKVYCLQSSIYGLKQASRSWNTRFDEVIRISDMHWGAIKSIFKYLKRTKDMFLIYDGGELILEGYSDASF
ncbi:UNVERIFIED_CONTAM: hypothetical protein Slati_1715700 [Sesamum latifolium]|uniref:Integrase catalytic domain-containing protein n=1 Tax=Sesamum latifolium TaxID=2727402 RepID=A0AAW2WWQ9_9LAMI